MTPVSGLLLGCIKVEAVTLRIRQEKLVQGNAEALERRQHIPVRKTSSLAIKNHLIVQ